eukprot:1135336-Rhodomonas_salina.1
MSETDAYGGGARGGCGASGTACASRQGSAQVSGTCQRCCFCVLGFAWAKFDHVAVPDLDYPRVQDLYLH